MFRRAFVILLIGLAIHKGSATVWRVPENLPTIQAALDSATHGDTVLVNDGIYAEALVAPPHLVCLIGVHPPDTSAENAATISPPNVAGADSIACLFMPPGSSALIRNMRFVNREWMYPRNPDGWFPGGISMLTTDSLIVENCQFDSTDRSICFRDVNVANPLVVRHTSFRDVSGAAYSRGYLEATDCLIEGRCLWGFFMVSDALVERCIFKMDSSNNAFACYRHGVKIIRDCVFGPGSFPNFWPVFETWVFDTLIIENCVFSDLALTQKFGSLIPREAAYVMFRHNLVTRDSVIGGQAAPLQLGETEDSPAYGATVVVEENVFADYTGAIEPLAKCIAAGTRWYSSSIRRNRFARIAPPTSPVLVTWHDTLDGTIELRENLFLNNGFAVEVYENSYPVDAILNFWGDASGPFHPALNPQGLGDRVSDSVLFDPWYPDTSFLAVAQREILIPRQFTLSVYPNPFNTQCRLKMAVPNPGLYALTLYDLLGRRIEEVWKGTVGVERDITFDASDLPSGIYFARASESITHRSVATVKLVLVK